MYAYGLMEILIVRVLLYKCDLLQVISCWDMNLASGTSQNKRNMNNPRLHTMNAKREKQTRSTAARTKDMVSPPDSPNKQFPYPAQKAAIP